MALPRTEQVESAERSGRARVEAASDNGARQELTAVSSKIDAVLAAIEDGIRTPSTKRRLEELELRREQLEANLRRPQPGRSKVRLHPRLAELYREKVAALEEALNDVEERGEAAEIMRSLIDKVVLTPEKSDRKMNAKLYGALAGILALAGGESCTGPGKPMQLSLVAEEGLEPPTNGL
jgi:site-specific DNA recombinase